MTALPSVNQVTPSNIITTSKNTFAYQGSTRTNSGIWVSDDPIFRGANNIFFNPSSMDINWAYVEEQIIKRDEEIKALKAEKPFRDFKLVNHYEANGEKYRLIDARKMLPTDKSVEPVIDNNAKLGLKLAFLRLYLENLFLIFHSLLLMIFCYLNHFH